MSEWGLSNEADVRFVKDRFDQTVTAAHYPYNRNNNGVREHNPTGYDQDVEPWGRYMNPGHGPEDLGNGWERGHVDFDNPLHVDEDNWKHNLSQSYGGAVGQALSDAILSDGYDGVMTNHPKYGPGEMVDIRPRDQRRYHAEDAVGPGLRDHPGM